MAFVLMLMMTMMATMMVTVLIVEIIVLIGIVTAMIYVHIPYDNDGVGFVNGDEHLSISSPQPRS